VACTQSTNSDPELTGTSEEALTNPFSFESLWHAVESWGWNTLFDGVWTNWYHYPKAIALVKLAIMRERITNENLFDTYPRGVRTKYLPADFVCPPESLENRTADGTCNDQQNPGMGAANVRFGRNVALDKGFPESEPQLLSPNPRQISRELLTRNQFVPVEFLNLLAASWIQFMVHDWFSHGDNSPTALFTIPLASDDPFRDRYHLSSLFIPRTAPDPTRTALDALLPPTYLNENTHWWDGSQIYGSDIATQNRVRSHQGGKLTVDARGLVPLDGSGIDDVGFKRNWWVGLSMMHNLFVLEHNKIADMLASHHPGWSDQQIFDKARLITAAEIAKIHTIEWTPAILPNDTLDTAMNSNWFGLLSDRKRVDVSPWKKLIPAPFGPILKGIVAGSRDLAGVPFALTEEFVSVYRMHSLMPESLHIVDHKSGAALEDIEVIKTRNAGARALVDRTSMTDLFASFGASHPGALVLNNYPSFLQNLSIPGFDAFDLGTVDILRDRERGVPRYNEFRRQLKLKPLSSFEQLTDDAAVVSKLKRIYGNDIERLDLLIGSAAEAHRPTYFGFGETTFQIFILIASRRLHGDLFFTDLYTPEVYTQEGLDWIDAADMKSVLIRNYPELSTTKLSLVANAFAPWK
jgi:hypothetical protein